MGSSRHTAAAMVCGLPLIILAVLAASANADAIDRQTLRYDGFQVLRITPESEHNAINLTTFLKNSEFDVWRPTRGAGDSADVMVSPEKLSLFKDSVKRLGLNPTVMVDNVQTWMKQNNNVNGFDEQQSSPFGWTQYHTLESINGWLKEKVKAYAKIASLISAGKTSEGRELVGLRIAHKPNLPIVFVESGIHAREWVTVSTAAWFIKEALEGKNEVLKAYEWHVFPSVNPDGYAYSRKIRMWRKTRRHMNGDCYGVDLNRNFPFEWNRSIDYCSDEFPGMDPGSELETKGIMSYLKKIGKRTRVYISLHSYSQYLTYPWGYTESPTRDNSRFGQIANKATKQIKAKYGTVYKYGPSSTALYVVYGSSIDYAYNMKIRYPFLFELRDTGKHGFLLPANQILPTATEALDGLTVILQEALKK